MRWNGMLVLDGTGYCNALLIRDAENKNKLRQEQKVYYPPSSETTSRDTIQICEILAAKIFVGAWYHY